MTFAWDMCNTGGVKIGMALEVARCQKGSSVGHFSFDETEQAWLVEIRLEDLAFSFGEVQTPRQALGCPKLGSCLGQPSTSCIRCFNLNTMLKTINL